jgi:mRNA interferase RelE/StbE
MNYTGRWQLLVDHRVEKQLRTFPNQDAQRILSAIAGLAVNPYSGDVVRMQGEEDAWRRRVGAYRIFFEVELEQKVVHVYDVQRRTSTTY